MRTRCPSPASATALRLLLNLQSRRRSPAQPRSTEAGLSLIECLVAIIIITLTVVAITPPIMLATATRVQSRKAEQANQVAQGEIDRIRALVEQGNADYKVNNLPADAGADIKDVTVAASDISNSPVLSPAACDNFSAQRYPGNTPVGANQLVLVDVDGIKVDDGNGNKVCQPEFIMQVFRSTGYVPNGEKDSDGTPLPFSFVMGVRVYSYYPGETVPTLLKDRASLRAGTASKEISANRERRPLATLYTPMARNNSSKALCQIRKLSSPTDACDTSSTPAPVVP